MVITIIIDYQTVKNRRFHFLEIISLECMYYCSYVAKISPLTDSLVKENIYTIHIDRMLMCLCVGLLKV